MMNTVVGIILYNDKKLILLIIIMSQSTCLRKALECLFERFNRKKTSLYKAKDYSHFDTGVIGEYPSPTEDSRIGNSKYDHENDTQIVQLPTAQSDLFPMQSTILINNCKGSMFFMLRSSASAYIDNCEDCYIYLGPSRGSVFIRNCKNIKLMAISQQLRIEYSENIIIQSIVASNPVIQYCKTIKFSSLKSELYDGVLWQMDHSNINLFRNQIYQTYDFTPKKNNYENVKGKIQQMEQFHTIWENLLQKKQLSFKPHKLYFPAFKPHQPKTKIISEKELKQNENMFLLCCKVPLKVMLQILSMKRIRGHFEIVHALDPQIGFRSLKLERKQQLLKLDNREGIWYFFLMVGDSKEEFSELGQNLFVVEDKEFIWNIFSQL